MPPHGGTIPFFPLDDAGKPAGTASIDRPLDFLAVAQRQERFIEAAATSGTYADAARQAGYKPSRANVTGSELMARPEIAQAVQKRRAEVLREAGYDPVATVQQLLEIAATSERDRDRIRAIELLLKLGGLFEPEEVHQRLHLNTMSVERLLQLEQTLSAGLDDVQPSLDDSDDELLTDG